MRLSPGLILLLYRRRWVPEKIYDQFNNKSHEKKSLASSVTAKAAHAVFLCRVHNLMVCYEATPAQGGSRNDAEEKRCKKVLTKRTIKVETSGRKMPVIISGFQHLTVEFIRWLRRFLWETRPLDVLLLILKKRYATL